MAVRYLYPSAVYPRFKYFEDRLLRLVPRFKRTIDAENLSRTFSQSEERLKKIIADSQCFNKQVSITVFPTESVPPGVIKLFEKGLVQNTDPLHYDGAHKILHVTSLELVKERNENSDGHSHVYVYVHNSETLEDVKHNIESSLSESQQSMAIVYNMKTKRNDLYSKMAEVQFKPDALPLSDLNKTLKKQVQHLLEAEVVEVVENISYYITKLVPKRGKVPDKSLLDELNAEVKLLSIRPSKHKYKLNDIMLEMLDNVFSQGTPAIEQKSHMEDVEQGASPSKKMKYSKPEIVYDLDIVYKKFIEFLCKKTKFLICQHLSKTHGISSSLMAEFLGESCLNYDKQCVKMLEKVSTDLWKKLNHVDKWDIASFFSHRCIEIGSDIVPVTEAYIKEKLEVLDILKKMQFEINALLRQTEADRVTKPFAAPKLSRDLQRELLELPEISSCGTIYGKLTLHLHAQSDINSGKEEDIEKILKKYQYMHEYSIEREAERMEHDDTIYKCGIQIRVKLTPKGQARVKSSHIFGSLGCFVEIRKSENLPVPSDVATESDKKPEKSNISPDAVRLSQHASSFVCGPDMEITSNEEDMELERPGAPNGQGEMNDDDVSVSHDWELYGVTCAHCVEDCEDGIEVSDCGVFNPIARYNKHLVIHEKEEIDIAAIKINQDRENYCINAIRTSGLKNKSCSQPHRLYEGDVLDLDGKEVFKEGPVTKMTYGIVISADSRSEKMKSCQNASFSEELSILIHVPADVLYGRVLQQFSEHEDWMNEIDADVLLKKWLDDDFLPYSTIHNIQERSLDPLERIRNIIQAVMTKDVQGYKKFKQYLNQTGQAQAAGHLTDIETELKHFSEKGDSGSVVCEEDINGSISMISLLLGNASDPTTGKTDFWYTSLLKKGIQELEQKGGCEIRLASAPYQSVGEMEFGLDMSDEEEEQHVDEEEQQIEHTEEVGVDMDTTEDDI